MDNRYVIIMAGGHGTRFWPASKIAKPKQFLDLLGTGETLLQNTYQRYAKICKPENIYVVSNQQYEALVYEQIPMLPKENLALEPMRKNTAPCLLYSLYKIADVNPKATVIVAPSDHVIPDEKSFSQQIGEAIHWSNEKERMVLLGIQPRRADPHFTYVQVGEPTSEGIYEIKTFAEKPTPEIAKTFIDSEEFLWYTGIAVWPIDLALEAFHDLMPDMYEMFEEGLGLYNQPGEKTYVNHIYPMCPTASIKQDFLFKLPNLFIYKADFKWSNLNHWGSLWEAKDKDYMENAVNGSQVVMYDSSNCIVDVPGEKLVIVEGLENYVVVDSPDALLIARRGDLEKLKQLTAIIKRKNGDKYL